MNAPRESHFIAYAAGELIFSEGSEGQSAYLVVEGEVDVCKSAGEQLMVLNTFRPGEIFGEMAMLTDTPRSASAIARTNAKLECLDRDGLARLLQERPQLAPDLVERLANMLPKLQDQLIERFTTGTGEIPVAADNRRWNTLLTGWLGLGEAAFEPEALLLDGARPPRLLRLVSGAMLTAIAVFMIWASVSFIDVSVPGNGKLVTEQPSVVVQTFEQGLLKEVRVKEGQSVRKGEILALLDPTNVEADQRNLERQRLAAEARINRLEAELRNGSSQPFSPDAEEQTLQAALYTGRRQQLDATLRSFREDIASLSQQIEARRKEVTEQEQQRKHAAELAALREGQYRSEKEVYQRDGVYKVQYLEASRQLAAIDRETLALRESISTLEKQRESKSAQLTAFSNEWRGKALEELATQRRELVRISEQLNKGTLSNSLVALRAPLDGVVQRIAFRNPGAVIRPAETVVELVPANLPLELEIDLNPRDIARVKAGDKALVRLEALSSAQQVALPGEVSLVSADAFPQSQAGERISTYRARVRLTGNYQEVLPPGFRLQPGMTASAAIQVGQRRIASYLFYPIQRALGESLREP